MLQIQRASAGSGKTYTLAKKFIWYLIAGRKNDGDWKLRSRREMANELPRILAITFTNKATNEMKERIVEKLAKLAVAADEKAFSPELLQTIDYLKDFSHDLGVEPFKVGKAAEDALFVLLNEYSDFRVSTIDSFFQTVLRTFAYESNLNDSYQVEIDSDYLAAAAIDATFDVVNRPGSADTSVGRLLGLLTRQAASAGNNWNVFQKSLSNESIYGLLTKSLKEIENENFKEIRNSIDEYFISAAEGETFENVYMRVKKECESPLKKAFEKARLLGVEMENLILSSGINPAEDCVRYFDGHLVKLSKLSFDEPDSSRLMFKPINLSGKSLLKKGKKHRDEALLTDKARQMYEAVQKWMDLKRSGKWLHWRVYAPLLPYLGLLGETRRKMNEFLDSNNLIQLGETNSMLRRIIGYDDAPFIYERLGSIINHYLIDEFQDTSRMQWDNLYPLLNESDSRGEDNLIIGDAKQSIYRFRNADPSLITSTVPSLFPTHKAAGMSKEENTNWRSKRNVVEFNNLFFRYLSEKADDSKLGRLDFRNLYGNVAQYASKRDREGYVEVRFLEQGEKKTATDSRTAGERFTEISMPHICPLISSLRQRGYRQRDIAILVDTNKVGRAVIAALVEYNASLPEGIPKIDFISEESLLVSQADSVGIIVNVLRHISEGNLLGKRLENPQDDSGKKERYSWNEIKCNFSFYSMRHPELTKGERIAGFLKEESPRNAIQTLLNDMQAAALPAIVEAVIENFVPLDLRCSQAVFIAAFQDMVLSYTEHFSSDIASFLHWWDSKGITLSISSPEGTDAVQIMTVHKAKGLEFNCVILPAAIGALQPGQNKKEWRWVRPASLFTESGLPPFIPVETTPKLLDTEHSEVYVEYHDLYMMDKLNSAYVAFTRAVDELYIFTVKGTGNLSPGLALTSLFTPSEKDLFSTTVDEELLLNPEMGVWSDDETILTVGEPLTSGQIAAQNIKKDKVREKSRVEENIIDEYGVDSSPTILHFVEETTDDTSTLSPESADNDPRSEGNLLHAIMENVERKEDLRRAVLKLRMRGLLSARQAEDWLPMLENALENLSHPEWFDGSMTVINEREILFPRKKNRRPDRIMLNAARTEGIIVDYKFGSVEEGNSHRHQVRDYMQLLSEALRLKSVKGFIWYVRNNKILEI